jgi:hypothetical protein
MRRKWRKKRKKVSRSKSKNRPVPLNRTDTSSLYKVPTFGEKNQ